MINFKFSLSAAMFAMLLMASNVVVAKETQTVKKRTYVTVRLKGKPPVIDGKLNDKAWTQGTWQSNFVQFNPHNGGKPLQKTEFKILYDNNNLYVAFRCFDTNPSKIVKRLTKHDDTDGDQVGIAFDSYFDKRSSFAFFVSAAGVRSDGRFSDDTGNEDLTWNAVWYAKTSINSKGWVAEMKIPLSQLRFTKKPDMTWGLEVDRVIYRTQEQDFWQFIPGDAAGFESSYGYLKGLKNIKPKREIALTPYVMSKLTKSPKIAGNPFATGRSGSLSAGLDGTVAVTNNLTMNFTINPDFGEVDADPSEVNLSAFETYFPELRPFFVEGSSIFNFPLIAGNDNSQENLFYSRRIGRPPQYMPELTDNEYIKMPPVTRILGAFKLSGKTEKGWSIGVMDALGNRETATLDSLGKRSKVAVEPLTNYFNARLRKNFKNGNTFLGGMITATNRFIHDSQLNFLPTAAYTGGIDFLNYWDHHTYQLSAKFLASSLKGTKESITDLQESPSRYFQRPGNFRTVDTASRVLQGTSASMELSKVAKGHWRYGIQSYMESPGLALNDQGYMISTDVINESTWLEYYSWEPIGIFRIFDVNLSEGISWNFSGTKVHSSQTLSFLGRFKNLWAADFAIMQYGYSLDWSQLRGGPALLVPGGWDFSFALNTDTRKKLYFDFSLNGFSHYQGVGKSLTASAGIHYRPVDFLNISLSPLFDQSGGDMMYVTTKQVDNKNVYFVSSIKLKQISANLRVNLSFTPNLSLEYWGQPFLYSANYYGYKKVVNPNHKDFNSQFYKYSGDQIQLDKADNQYLIHDPAHPGSTITLDNPDFSVVQFLSNMVLRWEFVPGSTLYLVWSQSSNNETAFGMFNFNNNLNTLAKSQMTNVFLVKFSYRIKV